MNLIHKMCLLVAVGVMVNTQALAADVDSVSLPFASLISESVDHRVVAAADTDSIEMNFASLIDERRDHATLAAADTDGIELNFVALIDEQPAYRNEYRGVVAGSTVDF